VQQCQINCLHFCSYMGSYSKIRLIRSGQAKENSFELYNFKLSNSFYSGLTLDIVLVKY
jgi:hypothetical protein